MDKSSVLYDYELLNYSLSALGPYKTEIDNNTVINDFDYENFLRIYLTKGNRYFFNLLSNTITYNGEMDAATYYNITVNKRVPWTVISYNEYRTISLWWIICVVNKIDNPVELPAQGSTLKIPYPKFVKILLNTINESIT